MLLPGFLFPRGTFLFISVSRAPRLIRLTFFAIRLQQQPLQRRNRAAPRSEQFQAIRSAVLNRRS